MRKFLFVLALAALSIQSYSQNSLLWEISSPSQNSPSYLFGTIHLSDNRFGSLHPKLWEALNKSDLFAMELILDSLNVFELLSQITMDPKYSIQELMNDSSYNKLKDHMLESSGIPIQLMDNIYPVFITYFLIDGSTANENDTLPVLDLYLYEYALQNEKKLRALETADEQMKALTKLPVKTQVEMLENEVSGLDKRVTPTRNMIDLYLNADLEALKQMSDEYKMSKKNKNRLIKDRNRSMSKRMDAIIDHYTAFFAVGALHLPGKNGLINLMRKKGYTVEPVMLEPIIEK